MDATIISNKKLKVTKTRRQIINLLLEIKKPLDANYFIDKVQSDRATIFRTLNQLVNADIIRKLDFEEGKARYEIADDHHHHLICLNCSNVLRFDTCFLDSLTESIKKQIGFTVKKHKLEFFGYCNNCSVRG